MSDDTDFGTNRRTVLKTLAAGSGAIPAVETATATDSSGTAPTSIGIDDALKDKKVYRGRQVRAQNAVALPSEAQRAESIRAADVAILSDNPSITKAELVPALNGGTITAFVGGESTRAAPRVLGLESANTDATKRKQLADLDPNYGHIVLRKQSVPLTVLEPSLTHGNLNTHYYGTSKTSKEVIRKVGKTVQLAEDTNGGQSRVTPTSCPPNAESGWNCLPTNHYEGSYGKYGSGEAWVYPAYAVADGDTYQSIEYHIDQTAGKSTSSSGFLNEWTVETTNFGDSNYEIQRHGPATRSGISSGGFSVGVSAGLPKGVSGSLGWNWTTQHSHTDIREEKKGGEKVKHTWEYKKKKDVSKNTVQCGPGYQAKRQDGADKMKFSVDIKWRFKDYKFFLPDKWWSKKWMLDYEAYY